MSSSGKTIGFAARVVLAVTCCAGGGWAQPPPVRPLPSTSPFPASNPSSPAKVRLGEKLVFDPALSGDNTLSCAGCHDPQQAFADGKPTGQGRGGRRLARNTQTLLNVAFVESLFWDGRAATLEEQALAPLASEDEMRQDLGELLEELSAAPGYPALFREAFGGEPTPDRVAMALAAYQRTLITAGSPFDRYLLGDDDAISAAAKEGWDAFQRNGCIRCHNGPLLSDGGFHRLSMGGSDIGREGVTGEPEDRFRFRTPTLRNVAETAPYFHDGRAATLFDAVSFYYRRTAPAGPAGLRLDFEPLAAQSFSEIDAIVAFLRSLSADER